MRRSCFLLGLFLLFKFLPKDLINMVLTGYFVVLVRPAVVEASRLRLLIAAPRSAGRRGAGGDGGALRGAAAAAPPGAPHGAWHSARGGSAVAPDACLPAQLSLGTLKLPAWLSEPVELTASVAELVCGSGGVILCFWYCLQKHWLANNALGLAFSLQGIEHLSLGSTQVGGLLLCGLFVYDIFWVFCTPVMVTVAKSFDAPIKLLFPRAVAAVADAVADAVPAAGVEGVAPAKPGRPFNMLGLGDIVVPGIFIALMLRMDIARAKAAPPAVPPRATYFRPVMAGYVLGLGTTIAVMNIFNAAQPALLYIVPACLLAVAGRAALAGELAAVLAWEEESAGAEEEKKGAAEGANKEGEAAQDGGWVKLPKGGEMKSPVKAKVEGKKAK